MADRFIKKWDAGRVYLSPVTISAKCMDADNDKAVVIFSGTLWEAEMVRTLLQDAGIGSFLQNSTRNSYDISPIIAGDVKVLILNSDIDDALSIMEDYYMNMRTGLK